jgi:hypothetical protein
LREANELEWRDAMGYLGVQIDGWLTWDESGDLVDFESSFSLTACEPLKSWVHDPEKALSMIKSERQEQISQKRNLRSKNRS